jgi:dethiobiotin synthetase
MRETFFITGSGTNVGKTLITAALAHQLLAQGRRVSALKPIISGYLAHGGNDTATLLSSQRLAINLPNIEAISPWRFKTPLAPSIAARREGMEIALSDVVEYCTISRTSEFTLIEGAGGVMAPINDRHTMLDWMEALGKPTILVAGTYLGAASHALTAGEMLRARGIAVQAVVVSESLDSAMDAVNTAEMLRPFMSYAKYIVPLPRVAGGEELWQTMADLTWMLA